MNHQPSSDIIITFEDSNKFKTVNTERCDDEAREVDKIDLVYSTNLRDLNMLRSRFNSEREVGKGKEETGVDQEEEIYF